MERNQVVLTTPITNIAEQKIVQYAHNYLAKNPSPETSSLDKMELTGLRNFQAMTKFTVKGEAFQNKLTNQLKATDCPESIITAIVSDIKYVDDEMSIQTECKVEGSEGHLYKIAYCLSKDDSKAKFAMVVFGASFNANVFERYEEIREPIYEDRPLTVTTGWLFKATQTTTQKVKIDDKITKIPKFKGMTNGDLQACISMLEAKACEKVLESSGTPSVPSAALQQALEGREVHQLQSRNLAIFTAVGAVGVAFAILLLVCTPIRQQGSKYIGLIIGRNGDVNKNYRNQNGNIFQMEW